MSDAVLYRDADRPVDERVDDLLSRMTLTEKVAQLGSVWVFQLIDGAGFSPAKAQTLLASGLGQVTRISGATNLGSVAAAECANAVQRHLVEHTRLGIPAVVHEEICAGLMALEATVFAQAIGLASTWEPELSEAMAGAIRRHMRATGAHQGLSPVLDICRDPRWGRLEESFGEDPHLVARMGAAFVRGLQGTSLRDGVVATAKHFVGYGASEGGMNWAPPHIPPRELRDVYLYPFEAAVRDAGLRSVMHAYHELDGIPCAADRDLLTGTLRDLWGFDGYVVSDYFAVRQLADYHKLAAEGPEAAAMALTAGLDVELPSTDCYGEPLLAAVAAGTVAEDTVDTAVRRVLRTKFDLGLFENPYVDTGAVPASVDTAAHRSLAGHIARKSLVLLRNDGVLPLAAGRKVALIGPNADDARNLYGDYSYLAHIESLLEMRNGGNVFNIPTSAGATLEYVVASAPSVRDALTARLGPVGYARGCDVNSTSKDGFAEAVALAAAADVAVMVMGDKAGLTDDTTSGEGRDRTTLDLPGVQEQLVRAVAATGTPVVLVLVTGRPGASEWAHDHAAAVLLAWLPGEEGADAIADVLTGAANPGGKLPVSYPRRVGQVPVYYGHKISGGRSHWKGDYVDAPSSPLYPFGYGLSYTTFHVGDVAPAAGEIPWNGSLSVAATVTNTGDRSGDEVLQLYVRDPRASVTRPVLELKAFARVELAPGEAKRVVFDVPVGQLGFHGRDLQYVVEPGEIEVFLGTSSADVRTAGSITVVPDPSGLPVEQVFTGKVTVTPA